MSINLAALLTHRSPIFLRSSTRDELPPLSPLCPFRDAIYSRVAASPPLWKIVMYIFHQGRQDGIAETGRKWARKKLGQRAEMAATGCINRIAHAL